MNYDVWGPWSPRLGPNAPLNDSCTTWQDGSAVTGVRSWGKAGFPAKQILLGVPSFGYSNWVSNAAALPNGIHGAMASYPLIESAPPLGSDNTAGVYQCGTYVPVTGDFTFASMIQKGFLTTSGQPANGMESRFSSCSITVRLRYHNHHTLAFLTRDQQPYVYDAKTQVMVSYDDPTSFGKDLLHPVAIKCLISCSRQG
jgi:chitinase